MFQRIASFTLWYRATCDFWARHPLLLYGLAMLVGPSPFLLLAPWRKWPFVFLISLLTLFLPGVHEPSFLVAWRFAAQGALHAHIMAQIPSPSVAAFLSGLFMGHMRDPFLKGVLGELGLQHILAISGFHFSLIAWFLFTLCRRFRFARLCIAFLLTLYLLFVGLQPSVLRAWIAALLVWTRCTALNRLGAGILLCLCIDPFSASSWSFQLSFLATAGILLFYAPLDQWLQKLWPIHTTEEALTYSLFDRGILAIAFFLRKTIALTLSVQLVLVPLLLHLFQTLSITGLLYNLFFPLLCAFSLILLLPSLALDLVGLGTPLHQLNHLYTQAVLRTATGLPAQLKWTVHGAISETVALSLIIVLLSIGIFLQLKRKEF